jgi:hypothetical protein
MRSQSNRDRDRLAVCIGRSDQSWDADRQRPGFVEHDCVGFGETLKSAAVLAWMTLFRELTSTT